jgi:hypothetical protein
MFVHGLAICGNSWYAPIELEFEENEDEHFFAVPVDNEGNLFDDYKINFIKVVDGEIVDFFEIDAHSYKDFLLVQIGNFNLRLYPTGESLSYDGELLHDDFKYKMKKINYNLNIEALLYEEINCIMIGCNPDFYLSKENQNEETN